MRARCTQGLWALRGGRAGAGGGGRAAGAAAAAQSPAAISILNVNLLLLLARALLPVLLRERSCHPAWVAGRMWCRW